MAKNTAQNLEDLDVKVESALMKWLKRIAYIVTIATTLSGGVLGVVSFVRDVKDPKAQAGYTEHSQMLKENSQNIRENREEIRYLYKAIIDVNRGEKPEVGERKEKLPEAPVQKPKKWNDLPIQRQVR